MLDLHSPLHNRATITAYLLRQPGSYGHGKPDALERSEQSDKYTQIIRNERLWRGSTRSFPGGNWRSAGTDYSV